MGNATRGGFFHPKGSCKLFVSGFNYIGYENIIDVTSSECAMAL
jgi:hypothetical protein